MSHSEACCADDADPIPPVLPAVSPPALAPAPPVPALAAGFDQVEYLTVVDVESLQPLDKVSGPARIVAATRLGRTRLIDNIAVD